MAAKSLEQLKAEATALGIPFNDDTKATDLSAAIKAKADGNTVIPQTTNTQDTPTAPMPNVTFTDEQLQVINAMMQKVVTETRTSNPNAPISMYNLRDPKKIETVNVKRFLGKFVMGFKNLQMDPFKKTPKYYRFGVDPIRKLANEPYVTLLLSDDGKVPYEEREVLLIDYMNERETFVAKVLEVKLKENIHDHGILGRISGDMGLAVDAKGNPESRPTIAQQSKTIERTFVVQLPGFDVTSEFISDFLA